MTKQDSKTNLRKAIDEFCEEHFPDEEILVFGNAEGDPLDEGFLGVGHRMNQLPIAVYDREKCIEALAKEFAKDTTTYEYDEDADPYTDASEFFSFNTEGSWVGEKTPMIIAKFSE